MHSGTSLGRSVSKAGVLGMQRPQFAAMNRRSRSVSLMRSSTVWLLVLCFALLTTMFAFSQVVIKQEFSRNMTVEEQEASIIYGFSSVTNLRAVIARSAGTASINFLYSRGFGFNMGVPGMEARFYELNNATNPVTKRKHPPAVAEAMQQAQSAVIYWVAGIPNNVTIPGAFERSFLAQLYEMSTNVGLVLQCMKTYSAPVFGQDPDCGRYGDFVGANLLSNIPLVFTRVQAVYQEEVNSSVDTNEKVSIAVSSSVIVLMVLVAALYTIPSFVKLDRERIAVLTLFTKIPKATVGELMANISGRLQEDRQGGNTAISTIGGANKKKTTNLKKLIFSYVFSMCVILTFIGCFMWLLLDYSSTSRKLSKEVESFELIRTSCWLAFTGTAAQMSARVNFAEFVLLLVQDMVTRYRNLVFGSRQLGLEGIQFRSSRIFSIIHEKTCSGSGGECQSMDTVVNALAADFESMTRNPPSNPLVSPTYQSASLLVQVLDTRIDQLLVAFQDYFTGDTDEDKSISIVLFVLGTLSIPVLWFWLLRPVFNKMEEESMLTRRSLTMLPLEVIESVSAIREYLMDQDKGSDKETVDSMQRNEERLRTVLQGSSLGFMEANSKLQITNVNAAAEKLFQTKATNIINLDVSNIFMDDEKWKESKRTWIRYQKSHSEEVLKWEVELNRMPFSSEGQLAINRSSTAGALPTLVSFVASSSHGECSLSCFLMDLTSQQSAERELVEEKKLSNDLLMNMLPRDIALRLKNNERPIADSHPEACIMFLDLVQFTQMAGRMEAGELVSLLDTFFNLLDEEAERHHVQKIKTIGDCYMCVCGIASSLASQSELPMGPAAARSMVDFSLQALRIARQMELQCRVGIHQGPIVAGVIGLKRIAYDIWGDTVNVASRLESGSLAMRIQVSRTVMEACQEQFDFESRTLELKGKGETECFLLVEREEGMD